MTASPIERLLELRPVRVAVAAWDSWFEHRTIRLGAGLAYYGLVALVPVTVVVVFVASLVFGANEVGDRLTDLFPQNLEQGDLLEVEEVVEAVAARLQQTNAGVIGVVAAIVSASFAAVAIEDALGVIWNVPRARGWRESARRRLVAIGIVVGFSVLISAVLVLQSVVAAVAGLLELSLVQAVTGVFLPWFGTAVVFAAVVAINKWLPRRPVSWRSALIGGLVTTFAIVVGGALLATYLHQFFSPTLAGAAASVGAVLLVIYYVSQIFLAGSELTAALENHRAPGADHP